MQSHRPKKVLQSLMDDLLYEPQDVYEPHDVRLKELFGNKDAFVSFLKDCVKADWADDIDLDSLRKSETTFILQDFRKKEADVIYEATINNGSQRVVFYVHLELQSGVDYRMPYRMLLYMVEILRHHYNNADVNKRDLKDFKFPAVIPIVFYSGSQRWTVPTNLREMFDSYERFGDSLVNFNYALVNAKGFDHDSIKEFQSRLLQIMMMFESAGNLAELQEIALKYDTNNLNEEELRIFNAALDIVKITYKFEDTSSIDETQRSQNKKGVPGLLSNLIANENRIRAQCREEGREEGIEQGIVLQKAETAKTLFGMGLTDEQVAKGAGLPIKDVKIIKGKLSQ